MTSPAPQTDAIASSAIRRINRRLIPFLFILYIVAYLDRVNVSAAGLEMTRELHFSNDVFGFGSGIFFIGYVLLEIPGTILVEVWSARKWIARIMVTWGLVAALTGLIHTAHQFYWARFLLGVAEAGFFPGVIVYLTHWYRSADRARAIAMFMSAIPLSQALSPISGLLMQIHWFGWSGWRWLLILEGAPAIFLGVVTLFYLTDRPQQARWLPDAEREWLVRALERERMEKTSAASHIGIGRALAHPTVLLLTLAYFCGATTQYGLSLWLPKILEKLSGMSVLQITLITSIPYLLSWPAMLLVGWSSDRTGERRLHVAVCLAIAGLALLGSQYTGSSVLLGLAMFSLALMAINGRLGAFWALPGAFLAGTPAAAAIGAINSIGNVGGFVGPYLVGFISTKTGHYSAGVAFLIASAFVGALATLLIHHRKPQETPA